MSRSAMRVRAVQAEDMQVLLTWRNDLEDIPLWSGRRLPVSASAFQVELERMAVGVLTLAVEDEDATLHAFAQIGELDFANGNGSLLYVVDRTRRARARANLAGYVAVVDAAFRLLPLRQLFAEVAAYNELSWRSLANLGWTLQGELRDRRWYAGRYWPARRYRLTAAEWFEQRPRFVRLTSPRGALARRQAC